MYLLCFRQLCHIIFHHIVLGEMSQVIKFCKQIAFYVYSPVEGFGSLAGPPAGIIMKGQLCSATCPSGPTALIKLDYFVFFWKTCSLDDSILPHLASALRKHETGCYPGAADRFLLAHRQCCWLVYRR